MDWIAGRLLAKPNNNAHRQIEANVMDEGLLKLPEQSVQVPTKIKHALRKNRTFSKGNHTTKKA